MEPTDNTTDELHLEAEADDAEDSTELGAELGASEDEGASAYDDHLSDLQLQRIRSFIPRHTVYTGPAGNGYVECLVESPEHLTDDLDGSQVGIMLIDESLAEAASELRGHIDWTYVQGGRLLELTYRYRTTGWVYTISLDGRFIHTFRELAIAKLAFDVLVDRDAKSFVTILARVIELFHDLTQNAPVPPADTCSESLTERIAQVLAHS